MFVRSTQTRLIALIIGSILLIVIAFFCSRSIVQNTVSGFDLLAHWKGTQLLLQENRDPYLASTSDDLKTFLQSEGWTGESSSSLFQNPLFSLHFYAPLTLIKTVESVRVIWMTLNFLFVFLIGFVLYSLLKLRLSIGILIFLAAFLLISFPTFASLTSGSLSIASLLLLIISISAFLKKNEEAAGLLLAFSLIDLQFSGITVLFFLFWSAFNQHFRVLSWFFITFSFLIGFSMLFLPIWPVHYFVALFNQGIAWEVPASIKNPLLMTRFLLAKDGLLILLLISEWFLTKKQTSQRLTWLVFLTILVSQILFNPNFASNAIAIIPAVFLSVQIFSQRLRISQQPILMVALAVLFLFSWFLSGVLLPGINILKSDLSLLFMTLLSILALYWIRWWINNSVSQFD